MSKSNKYPKTLALFLFVALAGLLMGASRSTPFETSKQLEIFTKVLQEVQNQYVDDIPVEHIMEDAINGMLRGLDPYTVYYPEDEIEDVRLLQTGEYGGIGCSIQIIGDRVFLSDIYRDGPAFNSGLQVGDELVAVDQQKTFGLTVSEVSALLRGTPGTALEVEVKRFSSDAPLLLNLERANIQRPAVPYFGMHKDGIGYIYLESFTERSAFEVQQALNTLLKEQPKGLVLDLRGNGGGLLMEAVKIISFFSLTSDTLVTTRGRNGALLEVYKRTGRAMAPKLPLAVLIDNNSASASEIVAGALQDLDRAVIIGEPSYGKGLVQQIHPLAFGAQLKVTVAKYYIPSGRCIQKVNYDRDVEGNKTEKEDLKSFKTAAGRTVYDGDGIYPDTALASEYYPEVISALSAQGLDLLYAARTPLAAETEPDHFELSDEQWASFTELLSQKAFSFESVSERQLKKLQENAAMLDYLNPEDLDHLIATVQQRRSEVVKAQREAIESYLEDFLVSKHLGESQGLARSVDKDPVIALGVAVLLDQATTAQLLGN